jgi:hypothetical protein
LDDLGGSKVAFLMKLSSGRRDTRALAFSLSFKPRTRAGVLVVELFIAAEVASGAEGCLVIGPGAGVEVKVEKKSSSKPYRAKKERKIKNWKNKKNKRKNERVLTEEAGAANMGAAENAGATEVGWGDWEAGKVDVEEEGGGASKERKSKSEPKAEGGLTAATATATGFTGAVNDTGESFPNNKSPFWVSYPAKGSREGATSTSPNPVSTTAKKKSRIINKNKLKKLKIKNQKRKIIEIKIIKEWWGFTKSAIIHWGILSRRRIRCWLLERRKKKLESQNTKINNKEKRTRELWVEEEEAVKTGDDSRGADPGGSSKAEEPFGLSSCSSKHKYRWKRKKKKEKRKLCVQPSWHQTWPSKKPQSGCYSMKKIAAVSEHTQST